MATFELIAVRAPRPQSDDYDWLVGPGLHEGRRPVAVLRSEERATWPEQIRQAGVTRRSPVLFPDPIDRMVFALDFGL